MILIWSLPTWAILWFYKSSSCFCSCTSHLDQGFADTQSRAVWVPTTSSALRQNQDDPIQMCTIPHVQDVGHSTLLRAELPIAIPEAGNAQSKRSTTSEERVRNAFFVRASLATSQVLKLFNDAEPQGDSSKCRRLPGFPKLISGVLEWPCSLHRRMAQLPFFK